MTTHIQTKNIHGKPRFGDARDTYLSKMLGEGKNDMSWPCTSKSLSTMPRRDRKAA